MFRSKQNLTKECLDRNKNVIKSGNYRRELYQICLLHEELLHDFTTL